MGFVYFNFVKHAWPFILNVESRLAASHMSTCVSTLSFTSQNKEEKKNVDSMFALKRTKNQSFSTYKIDVFDSKTVDKVLDDKVLSLKTVYSFLAQWNIRTDR